MNNDPADQRAKARAGLGLSRELQQTRAVLPDPSRGGSRGYPVYDRIYQLQEADNGRPTRASASSLWRWRQRLLPHRMTGNKARTSIVGGDMVLMSICLFAWPDSSLDEIATFIYNEGGGLFANSTIARRLKELHVTRKLTSTEAYQAFTPENMWKVETFWTDVPPLGVVGVLRRQLLDVDEFGVALQQTNRKRGYSLCFFWLRKPGHYQRSQKLTVLIGIEPGDPRLPPHISGSVENPGRWLQVVRGVGTTTDIFNGFIRNILTHLEERSTILQGLQLPVETRRYFLWDNLSSHLTPTITNTLYDHNGNLRFSSINRSPYQPKYGPIEYKICDVLHELQVESNPSWTTDQLEQEIPRALSRIGEFDNAFAHCGYSVNGQY